MRPLFKRLGSQRGLALLIILVIVMLGTMTVLVSRLNSTDIHVAKQKQTMLALAQAKSALLGFAASYAETHSHYTKQTHSHQPIGYLPCPDEDGDGSADPPCSQEGKSVLGRFPWRTLGLPPLRDGDGECLWYAVSGSYKDAPKVTLTSDTNGLFIVKDANNSFIAGNTPNNRAIAIIFAPATIVNSQSRGGSNGTTTECGRKSAYDDPINQTNNYLENLAGIDNATGADTLKRTLTDQPTKTNYRVFHSDSASTISTFVMGPLTKTSGNTGNVTFNDTLMLITPEDYQSIYARMDLWVAKKVTDCINEYVRNNEKSYFDKYKIAIDNYREDVENKEEIEKYVEIKKQKYIADFHEKHKDDLPMPSDPSTTEIEDKARQDAIDIEKKYPWAASVSDLDDANYADVEHQRFGRIPTTLANVGADMGNTWPDTSIIIPPDHPGNCFNESDGTFENYKWSWWDQWKKMVFYAINEENTPPTGAGGTHIWVKSILTKCDASSETCKENTDKSGDWWIAWVAALAEPFDTVTDKDTILMEDLEITWKNGDNSVLKTKQKTLAKMKSTTEWEKVNVSMTSLSSPQGALRLNGGVADFVILVAGRRLSLGVDQQVRNSTADESLVKNYLEDENIPLDILSGNEVNTIPPGDETFFKKPITSSFNDVACRGRNGNSDCIIP